MKKTTVFLLICIFTLSLFANEFQSTVQTSKEFVYKEKLDISFAVGHREQDPPPNYSFILNGNSDPTTYLFDSFYDYMPYSYNGHNVRLQPELSMPYGYDAGGLYISYHCSETASTGTDRRAFNSYINPDGSLFGSSATNHYDVEREGFTSIDIDPVTGNPFICWHSVIEDDNSYDCSITYDNFHLTGSTGYWKEPWILFDNPEVSEPYTEHSDDEFIWPVLMVGDSPDDGYRRIHTYGNNYTSNDAGSGHYNSLYGYADFNDNDLLMESELEWTYTSFPLMDDQHYNDKNRVNKDMIVKDNQVAFFGNYGDTLFVLLSEDSGETFTWFKEEWKIPVENPLWQDGETYEFLDDDGETPSELFFVLSNDGSHYNACFTENSSKIVWMSGVNINSAENIEGDLYMAAYFYPKIFSFDIETGEFDFYDMDIQGVDPADDQPAIPWDLDEDGNVDEYYTDDGSVYIPLSMASWFYNSDQGYQDSFFHESNFKMVANNNWIVAGWHDSKKLRWAYWGEEGYDGWLYQPEMVFSISDDFGETWSEPLFINANSNDDVEDPENYYDNNYASELEGMLPVNVTFGETLEILSNDAGSYHAKLHIAFFDDNDYGSAVGQTTGGGELNGGKLRYAALDLEFQNPWIPETDDVDDNTVFPSIINLSQNYPNPFNPETTISYNVKIDTDVKLEVFNLKGQLVTTLLDEFVTSGNHTVIWEGKDLEGKTTASGMYFYKLSSGDYSSTKKMILMK
jgi:type IX secretion system substrate protein